MPTRKRSRPLRKKSGSGKRSAQEDVRALVDLEQIRMLADPLRLRIVELCCGGERTTEEVAEKLKVKPTKLYQHIDALEKVGLLRTTRTRRDRGRLEKYYAAVAGAFRADPRDFTPGGERSEAVESMMTGVFERTSNEMRTLLSASVEAKGTRDEGVLSFVEVSGSEADMAKLHGRVDQMLRELQRQDVRKPGKRGERRYRLTLAFYPVERSRKD